MTIDSSQATIMIIDDEPDNLNVLGEMLRHEGWEVRAFPRGEMALAAAEQPQASVETIRAGVLMIHQQLRSAFMDAGLEELNAQGQPFDPSLHEAVSQKESVEVPEGTVLHQLRKGYRLRDRLLRPASVVVAKRPEPTSPSAAEQ